MATLKPKPGVSYNKDTNTVSIDQTVAGGATTKDVESVTGKVNLENTQYGTKMDPSTGAPEKITTNTPVINTNNVRNQAQENAKLVEDKAGTKKVISTVTSNGKITKTYSDGTTDVTESGISGETGTPDRRQILDEQKNIYTDQENLQADISGRYDKLKVSQDESYNQLVENTKNQFASLRTKLTDSNRRFEMRTAQGQYLNNGFRYTPQSSEGMVYQAEQAGIARLSDLNLNESIALQKALQAKNESDYAGLQAYTNDIRQIQQDRLATLDKMNLQIKNIEDTDKNIRNMNENEAAVMNSMIDYYMLSQKSMSAKETEEFYDKKSKELSELMGFTVAPEFIKAQVEGGSIAAKTEINEPLSVANGYYTDKLGRPITDKDGKSIPLEKEDWFQEVIGNTLNIGTYDEDGNKVMKEYTLKGETKTYAETLEELPQTAVNVSVQALAQTYTGPMSELIVQNNVRIPTTVKEFKNLQGGGMQCAEYVNRVMGTSFGSSMSDKLGKATDKTGQVGSAAVWDAGDAEHGHVGIIIGDNGDTWTIRSSNAHGDTMVTTDVVPKSAIKGYHTTDAVKKMPSSASGIYDPLQDKNLVQVGNSTEGGLFYDNTTGKTMTGNEAKAMYGQTTPEKTSQFTPDQIAVMSTITGKPTAGDKETLAKYGLDEAKLGTYRAEKAANSSAYDNLDTSVKSRIDKYVLDYENEQIVKDYNTMSIMVDSVKANQGKKSSTNDQALIYAFAKVMDPNSVVRESEYATVQEYSQALLERMVGKMKRVFSSDGFLSDEAKQKMIDTLESKVETQKTAYDNVRNQTKKQIKGKASTLSDEEIDDMLKQYEVQTTIPGTGGQNTSSQPTGNWFDN